MKKSNVGIISAFRDERTLEENEALTKELRSVIREKGFGYVPVQGEWKENENSVSVEKSFAISRPGLTREMLIANLVEIGRANPEFNQQAYFVASEGKGYLIAGEDNEKPAGEVLEVKNNLTVAVMEQWLSLESGGRTTMAKGPEGRGFQWSCAQQIDSFSNYMALIKGMLYSNMEKAPERVFGIKKPARLTGGYYGRQLIKWGVSEDIDGFPIMEKELYVSCQTDAGGNGLSQWKKQLGDGLRSNTSFVADVMGNLAPIKKE